MDGDYGYDVGSDGEPDDDEPIEYAYPTSFRTLANCHDDEPANLFNPWTDMAGDKAFTWGELDQNDDACMFLPSQSYFHLSCASRRSQIQENGLMVNSTALTDVGDSLTGKLFFMCNWFANPDFRRSHDMTVVKNHYTTIACMVGYGCLHKEGSTMDLWLVYDTDDDIVPHSSEGLADSGEFESTSGIPARNCFLVPTHLVPPQLEPTEEECNEIWVSDSASGVKRRRTRRRSKPKRSGKRRSGRFRKKRRSKRR